MGKVSWVVLAEFLRSLVITYVLSHFIVLLGITNLKGAL